MTTLGSQTRAIGELLGGNSRHTVWVPQYQRGFSWLPEHIAAFWEDIRDFQESKRSADDRYFLGPVVVMRKKGRSSTRLELLDGQQRMATATILLAEIRNKAAQLGKTGDSKAAKLADNIQHELIGGDDDEFFLSLGEEDRSYFEELVQCKDPNTKAQAKVRSHVNIKKARTYFEKRIAEMIGNGKGAVSRLDELHRVVRADLAVTCISVGSEEEAFKIFETLNARGLRLAVPDLLLNFLMGSAERDQRASIRTKWGNMVDSMGTRQLSHFLRHRWIAANGDLKEGDLFVALKKAIKKDKLKPLKYVRECSNDCDKYVEIIEGNGQTLQTVRGELHTLLTKLGAKGAMPLLLVCYERMSTKNFRRLVRLLIVFVVRHSMILEKDKSALEDLLFNLAKEMNDKEKPSARLDGHIGHVKARLAKAAPSDKEVAEACANLILSQQHAVYIMGCITNFVQSRDSEVVYGAANLEHIFPQGAKTSDWPNRAKLEPYLDHIGNLMMLGGAKNDAVANRSFSAKSKVYRKSSLKLAKRVASKYVEWGPEQVVDRAKKLSTDINAIWSFAKPERV